MSPPSQLLLMVTSSCLWPERPGMLRMLTQQWAGEMRVPKEQRGEDFWPSCESYTETPLIPLVFETFLSQSFIQSPHLLAKACWLLPTFLLTYDIWSRSDVSLLHQDLQGNLMEEVWSSSCPLSSSLPAPWD